MDVLVVNAGSTSLKLALVRRDESVEDVAAITAPPPSTRAVGHRIVHGGTRFREPVVVDDAVEVELRSTASLAPLHNTPALDALAAARHALPDVPHVAVFDTAFHATLVPEAATYAVPRAWRDDWGIRRFGFHGLSVAWAAERVSVPRLVVCHLGGGCSVTAVRDGRSIDTTMGFTPLEGIPMATRSGSIDPGVLLHVLRNRLSVDELEHSLEHESGLVGLAGTPRFDEIEAHAAAGDADAALALDVFVLRVAQAVAAMAASLGGIDAVVFTGGIGENSALVRDRVVERVAFLGLAAAAVVVVPAREELVVARATRALLDS